MDLPLHLPVLNAVAVAVALRAVPGWLRSRVERDLNDPLEGWTPDPGFCFRQLVLRTSAMRGNAEARVRLDDETDLALIADTGRTIPDLFQALAVANGFRGLLRNLPSDPPTPDDEAASRHSAAALTLLPLLRAARAARAAVDGRRRGIRVTSRDPRSDAAVHVTDSLADDGLHPALSGLVAILDPAAVHLVATWDRGGDRIRAAALTARVTDREPEQTMEALKGKI